MSSFADFEKMLAEANEATQPAMPAQPAAAPGFDLGALEQELLGMPERQESPAGMPTEDEIRGSFKFTPRQYHHTQFENLLGDIQEMGEIGQPEIRLSAEGHPSGIKGFIPNELGGSDPIDVELPEGFREDIVAFGRHQEGLVARLEEHGETISPIDRLKKGIKYTPEGAFDYLLQTFGKENVFPVFDQDQELENVIVIEDGQPKLVEKDSFEWEDLLDATPEILHFAAGLGASMLAGRKFGPKGVALAEAGVDVGMDVARQAASAALPGEDFPEQEGLEELGTRAAGTAAVVGAGVGGNVAAEGLKRISPLYRASQAIGGQKLPGTTEELMSGGGQLAAKRAADVAPAIKQTGVPLDVLERTGAPLAATLKTVFESFPGSVDVMGHAKRIKMQKFGENLDRLADAVAGGQRVGAEPATAMIAKTYKQMGDEIYTDMRDRAAKHFAMAEAAGSQIPLTSFRETMQDIASEAMTPARTGPVQAITKFAKKQLQNLAAGVATPKQMQNMLADFGQRAKGRGKLWTGEVTHTESQRIANVLLDALRRDLNAAAESGIKGADSLKQARQIYRQGHVALEAARDTVLDKAIKLYDKGNPSRFVKTVMSGDFSATDIARAMDAIGAVEPSAVLKFRGAVLDNFARSSITGVEEAMGQPGKFLTMFTKYQDQLKGLFKTDPKGWQAIQNAAHIAERIVEGGIAGGAKGQPVLTALWMMGAKSTAGIMSVLTLGKSSEYMAYLARAFNNPESRKMLMNPPPAGWVRKTGGLTAKGAKFALSRLMAMAARDKALFGDVEEPELGTIGTAE